MGTEMDHVHPHIPAAHVLEMALLHPNPSAEVPPAAPRVPLLLRIPGRFIRQGSLKLRFSPEQGLCVVVPSAPCPGEVPEGTGTFREERTSLRKLSLFSGISPFVR